MIIKRHSGDRRLGCCVSGAPSDIVVPEKWQKTRCRTEYSALCAIDYSPFRGFQFIEKNILFFRRAPHCHLPASNRI